MKQKWDQLFTYERRDAHGSSQLENNTTKNLLKTLRDIDVDATNAILTDWFPESEWAASDVQYEFQSDVRQVDETAENYLVGISRFRYADSPIWAQEEKQASEDQRSIVDGCITVDRNENRTANILIEVKTGGSPLEESQMACYRRAAGINASERTHVVQWLPLYRRLRTLQNGDTVGALQDGESGPSGTELDRESYLLKEFADYLEIEQLKPVLAQIGEDDPVSATKILRMTRQRTPNGKWPLGTLLFEFEWKEGGNGIGPFPASAFGHLLAQIGTDGLTENDPPAVHAMDVDDVSPANQINRGQAVREEIFVPASDEGSNEEVGDVNPDALRTWVDSAETVGNSTGEYFAATRHPDGEFPESGKIKRLRLEDDEFFCLKHFSETDNHSTPKPHLSEDEFRRLFAEIPRETRRAGLVEANMMELWDYILSGESHAELTKAHK